MVLTFTCVNSRRIFKLAAIFPVLGVLSAWAIFYSVGHSKKGLILTVSETMNPFPESRIFSTTMHMEMIFLIIVYWIRYQVTKSAANQKGVQGKLFSALMITMAICNILMVIGVSMVSAVTLKEHTAFHLTGASLFFYLSIVYYFVADAAAEMVGISIKGFSKIINYILPFIMVAYVVLIAKYAKIHVCRNIGGIAQYILASLIFLKIYYFGKDLPQFQLTAVSDEIKKTE